MTFGRMDQNLLQEKREFFEDIASNTKTSHQRLELMHSQAASQKIHDSVLDRKRAWILMMSNTTPLDFF